MWAVNGSGEVIENLHMTQRRDLPASLVVLLVIGVWEGIVVPSGLVQVFGLGVSSLGILFVSSSLFASMVSPCVFHCQLSMVYGLEGVLGSGYGLRVAGNGGTGHVTGEAQWVLASFGWRCWEAGGGHAWSLSCVGTLGTDS